jgi:hypothetical protein
MAWLVRASTFDEAGGKYSRTPDEKMGIYALPQFSVVTGDVGEAGSC